MSKYGETQTVLRNEKFLLGALEVHPEGANLNSYLSLASLSELL